MAAVLVAIAIGIWFYTTAKRIDLSPWKWAAVGALSFWIPEVILTLVLLNVVSPIDPDAAVGTMVAVFVLSFGMALAVSVVIRNRFMRRRDLLDDDALSDVRKRPDPAR